MQETTDTEKDKWCIHGRWKDGVCVCNPGWATFFNDKVVTQQYCNLDEKDVAQMRASYAPKHYFYLSSMTVTVLVTVVAFLVFATAITTIVRKVIIMKKIKAAKQELTAFESGKLMREDSNDLNVTFWEPPSKFLCINQQKSGGDSGSVEAKVIAAYNPQNAGELPLKPGVTVTNVQQLDRGWCKGTIEGKTGFFPAAFVEILTDIKSPTL